MEQAKILVKGHVQGVGYRFSAKRQADRLNIFGYAKNMPDNSVEILAQGEKHDIDQFIEWCREGPPVANVEKTDVAWQPMTEILSYFDIL
jgi:acylphosphatase